MRSDVLVAALIIGLCTFAVVKQLDAGDDTPPIDALNLGEALDPDQVITLIGRPPLQDTLGAFLGEKATVFMTWSIKCPCVEHVEHRLRHVFAKYPPGNGVAWIAVNGEPAETNEQTMEHMRHLKSFYKMVLDPRQLVTDRFGLHKATQVAVFDGEHKLVYRGPIDDDYDNGDAGFLSEVLEGVTGAQAEGGSPFEYLERPGTYGCPFDDPESCELYEQLDKAREEREAAAAKKVSEAGGE